MENKHLQKDGPMKKGKQSTEMFYNHQVTTEMFNFFIIRGCKLSNLLTNRIENIIDI